MNDLELMLITIGDLEFSRRKQAIQIQELAQKLEESEALKRSSGPAEEPEA